MSHALPPPIPPGLFKVFMIIGLIIAALCLGPVLAFGAQPSVPPSVVAQCAAKGGCVYISHDDLKAFVVRQANKAYEAGFKEGSEDTRVRCRNFTDFFTGDKR